MYINRHLEKQVLEVSHYYPVVMVCGQRQVGKSTILLYGYRTRCIFVSLAKCSDH